MKKPKAAFLDLNDFFPAGYVFEVFAKDGRSLLCHRLPGPALALMQKKGRNSGHVLSVCVEYLHRVFGAGVCRVEVQALTRHQAQAFIDPCRQIEGVNSHCCRSFPAPPARH